jgi:hypothetical protein
MSKPCRPSFLAIVLSALLFGASVAAADPGDAATGESEARNVLLTVRLGKLVNGKPADVKSYDLVVVSGGMSSRLLSGARVPFPTQADDDDAPEVVYQNIGFTTEAHAWVLEDGRVKVAATIEDSRVQDDPAGGPPTVETRQVAVNAILTPGRPLEVTRVQGIRDGSGFVEIEATTAP